jgi:hypothetical protein
METKTLLVNLFLVLMLLSIGYFFIKSTELEQQLANANSQISDLNAQKHGLQSQLVLTQDALNGKVIEVKARDDTISGLRNKLAATETAWNATKAKLAKVEGDLDKTKEEFESLETEIQNMDQALNDSISWFKDNSVLPAKGDFSNTLTNIYFDGFLFDVEHACTMVDGKTNTINLGCLNYEMEKTLSITYKTDPNASDRLFSVHDIIVREGGDCEDFSLFYKALLNRLKLDLNEGYTLEAWGYSPENHYVVYGKSTDDRYWYLPNAHGISLGKLGDFTPYVVCFSKTNFGHCIIALSNQRTLTLESVGNLDGALLFEPQTGEYLGQVGNELATCKKGDRGCERWVNYISFVITDEDLLQFQGGEWQSYANYKKENNMLASNIKESLKSFN